MKVILSFFACCFVISTNFAQFQHSFGTEASEMGMSLTQFKNVEEGYLVAGYTSAGYIGGLDATLVKTDLNGNQIWSRVYGGDGFEYFNSVRESTLTSSFAASYVAAGITTSFGFGSGDAYVTGVNSVGAPLFTAIYGGQNYDAAHCIQNCFRESGELGYIFTGQTNSYTSSLPGTNMYVVQTDLFGNLVNATVIGYEGNQLGQWIEQTKDGGYIVVGSSTNYECADVDVAINPPVDIFVVKLKPDLSIEWNRIIGHADAWDPTVSHRNLANCVKEDNDGNFVITGYTNSFGINNSFDPFLLSLDTGGNFLWLTTYGTEYTEFGYGLEITQDATGAQVYTVVGQNAYSSTVKAFMFQTDHTSTVLQWSRMYGYDGFEGGVEMTTDDFERGFAFTGVTTSFGAAGREIYLVETTDTGKSDTECERDIDFKIVKHEPCITRNAKQIFVDDHRIIDQKVVRVEYEQGGCYFRQNNTDQKSQHIDKGMGVIVYPNPAQNSLAIHMNSPKKIKEVHILDLQGREVKQEVYVDTGTLEIPIEGLKTGTYLIKIHTESGITYIKRFNKK